MGSLTSVGIIISLAVSFAVAEKAGRIDSENQSGFKCHSLIDSLQKCQEMRNKALNRGCITREEYDVLVRHYRCPICDWDIPGLDAYEGHCFNFIHDNEPPPREKSIPKAMQYRILKVKD